VKRPSTKISVLKNAVANRIEALLKYRILDTLAEKEYDEIVALASQICDTPIALMSLLDDKRQWFKSKVGVDLAGTSIDSSFCRYTVNDKELVVVHDAAADARFRNSPLVSGPPFIRSYAGAPLINKSGTCFGTLCVIDTKPRIFSTGQLSALTILSHQVVTNLELRRVNYELREKNWELKRNEADRRFLEALAGPPEVFKQIFDELSLGIVKVDALTGGIQLLNQAYAKLLGYEERELVGRSVHEITAPEDRAANIARLHKFVCSEDRSEIREKRYLKKNGEAIWVRVHSTMIRQKPSSAHRERSAVVGVIHDISSEKNLPH
jgi:PAS domain S-box-containing protein